jgi:hypothetical protein
MRRIVGRIGAGALELLLPSARAQACTPAYCQAKSGKRRCCKVCPGGITACTGWVTGSCSNYVCAN